MVPRLLTIPQEIRDEILGYCLIYDGELIPYPTWYELEDGHVDKTKEMPCVNLLAVNKSIRAEAVQILYGRNTWRIPMAHHWNVTLGGLTDFEQHFRNVTLNLDFRMVDSKELLQITKQLLTAPRSITLAERMKFVHDLRLGAMHQRLVGVVELLFDFGLKSLRLDFTNCFDPNGCCRIGQNFMRTIWNEIRAGRLRMPALILAIGLTNIEELEFIHNSFFARCDKCYIGGEKGDIWYCKTDPTYKLEGWAAGGQPIVNSGECEALIREYWEEEGYM